MAVATVLFQLFMILLVILFFVSLFTFLSKTIRYFRRLERNLLQLDEKLNRLLGKE